MHQCACNFSSFSDSVCLQGYRFRRKTSRPRCHLPLPTCPDRRPGPRAPGCPRRSLLPERSRANSFRRSGKAAHTSFHGTAAALEVTVRKDPCPREPGSRPLRFTGDGPGCRCGWRDVKWPPSRAARPAAQLTRPRGEGCLRKQFKAAP